MRRLLVFTILGLVMVTSAASAETLQASAASVGATVTFTPVPEELKVLDPKVVVTRGGVPVVDRPLLIPRCIAPYCRPLEVHVADLDADGEPEVLVDGYTGGAHCCLITLLLRWNGSEYTTRTHEWADASYEVKDLDGDGRPELKSYDARFGYSFASYAGSAMPLQIWQVDAGVFEDVTAGFPQLIRADAARYERIWRGRRGHRDREPDGTLAAWAADMELLGKRATVTKTLAVAVRRRWTTQRFVRDLDRFLRRTGYRR